jgi:hypothetical protein
MARLLINPGSPAAWEVRLKPGTNRLGRGFANDFKIEDPSVSGSHCEIVLNDGRAFITDLGSTNGTFINHAPVQEAALEAGQTIHMGGVEMVFHSDPPEHSAVNETEVLPLPPIARPVVARVVPPKIPGPLAPLGQEAPGSGSQNCKFHPKTLGRFLCNHCKLFFCELCVISRAVGGAQHKYCRRCGAECAPVKIQIAQLTTSPKGFFASIPGAFLYPFRGSGILVLIVATILFGALNGISPGTRYGFIPKYFGWGLIFQVFAVGYLFAYMQAIIHVTAVGDEEMPTLPSMASFWEDVLIPCLQLLGLVLVCFGPAIGVAWYSISSEESSLGVALIATFVLGALYFPMAFLAVAMLDSVMAANPLQVVPSIFKVPLEYLVTMILLACVLGLRPMGDLLLPLLFPRGLSTHSMPKLFAYLAASGFWSLVSLYLLTVGMRILGLLYLTKKEKLGWLDR